MKDLLMNVFNAGVQYNDFTGTVAADRSDENSLSKYLFSQGLTEEDEIVIGFRFGFSENHGREVDLESAVIYLKKNVGEFEKAPKSVRAIDVPMTLSQFFSFFKRFDLVANIDGLELGETEVDGPHYE